MKKILLLALFVSTSLAQNALPALNHQAPELALSEGLQTPGGTPPTLASLHGHLVVLEFWATWCGGCVAAIPHLNETAEKVKDKPITFLSVTDEDAGLVKAFLAKRPMQSWVGVDKDGTTFARYGIFGRPQTLLIDENGVLRAALQPEQISPALLENALAGKFVAPDTPPAKEAALPLEFTKGVPPPLLQVLIRPAAPGTVTGYAPGFVRQAAGGRIEYYGIPVATLLYYAENDNLRADRLVAPDWFNTDRYDVSVAVPAGRDDLRNKLLMQAATDTFSLKSHHEQRPVEVYVLSVAGRSKLKPSAAAVSRGFTPQPGAFTGVATPMAHLTHVVSRQVNGTEVIDDTGLAGNYDFDLTWKQGDVASLTNALHDQLGLTLSKQTRPRDFLVVDDATQPQTW